MGDGFDPSALEAAGAAEAGPEEGEEEEELDLLGAASAGQLPYAWHLHIKAYKGSQVCLC